jgi:glycine/D-amino acid oxidase-like deaminating enzyme
MGTESLIVRESSSPLPAQTEFLVIGAGYSGLVATLELAKAGRQVVLIDALPIGGNLDPRPGGNQSSISGGHVTFGYSQDYKHLEKTLGRDRAKAVFLHSIRNVQRVREYTETYNMRAAGWRAGLLFLARNDFDRVLLRSMKAVHQRYLRDRDAERLVPPEETSQMVSSPAFRHGALYSALGGQIEPRGYVLGLSGAAASHGAIVCGETKALDIELKEEYVTVTLESGRSMRADKVIVSGGTQMVRSNLFPEMRKHMAMVGNAAVRTVPLSDDVLNTLFPSGYPCAFSDLHTTDVLYARLDRQSRLDFGAYSFAGKTPNTLKVLALLHETFPVLREKNVAIESTRFGFLCGTRSLTAQFYQPNETGQVRSISQFDPSARLLVMGGFGGEGITLGTGAGFEVAQAFLGNPEGLNLLAGIPHGKLPITFPVETLNRLRDNMFVKGYSLADQNRYERGVKGTLARRLLHWAEGA